MGLRRLLTLCLAMLALGLAACGEDSSEEKAEEAREQAAEQGKIAAEGSAGAEDTAAPGEKPEVTIPAGEPPAELEIKDLKEGSGEEASLGDQVSVNYVGVAYSTKKEFDNSYDRGQPFEFQLGAGMVIPGWDQGVAGMKVGGRRQLTIPAELGYGEQGSPPDIKGGETLVFVIDLLALR